jgi:hypothetical protein
MPVTPVQRASETFKMSKGMVHSRHVIPRFRNIPNNKKEPQSAKTIKDLPVGRNSFRDANLGQIKKPKLTPMESPAEKEGKRSLAKTLKRYFGDKPLNSGAASEAEKMKRATMKTHRMMLLG